MIGPFLKALAPQRGCLGQLSAAGSQSSGSRTLVAQRRGPIGVEAARLTTRWGWSRISTAQPKGYESESGVFCVTCLLVALLSCMGRGVFVEKRGGQPTR